MAELEELKVGMTVKFKGYSQEEADPLLHPGDLVQVRTINTDGGIVVDQLDADGKLREDVQQTETLFPEEVELMEPAVAEETKTETADAGTDEGQAPATETAPAAEAPKGKGKGKAIKATAKGAKTETPAETPTETTATDTATDTGPRSSLVREALASVAGQAGATGSAALLAAKDLIDRVDKTYYTLGGVLAYIKETGVYKSLGFDGKRGFADYCKAELDTDYRKAQYLIGLYERVQDAGLNEARLAEIGWSKAIQIVRVGDVSLEKLAEDFDTLVDYAKEHSRDDLISHLEKTYEGITTRQRETTQVNVTKFVFALSAEQASTVESALATAKPLAGTDKLDDAFAYICTDWQMMTEGSTFDLSTALDVLEHRHGKEALFAALVERQAAAQVAEIEAAEQTEAEEAEV